MYRELPPAETRLVPSGQALTLLSSLACGCTKTQRTTYVYNLKETLDIILPDLFITQTESQRADFSSVAKLIDQKVGHESRHQHTKQCVM